MSVTSDTAIVHPVAVLSLCIGSALMGKQLLVDHLLAFSASTTLLISTVISVNRVSSGQTVLDDTTVASLPTIGDPRALLMTIIIIGHMEIIFDHLCL